MSNEPVEGTAYLIRELYRITDQLEASLGRPFTLDGHLVGSLGETYAVEMFGLVLMAPSNEGFDALTADGDLRVEIKTTQRSSVSLSSAGTKAEQLIVLSLDRLGHPTVEYNGPSSLAWEGAGAPQKNGQRKISLSSLHEIMSEMPAELRLDRWEPSPDRQSRVQIFLYGTLMPGQVGYHAIEDVVTSIPIDAVLHGHELVTRDGMPFAREKDGSRVNGIVVEGGLDLQQTVRRFEGLLQDNEPKLYREATVDVALAGDAGYQEVTAYLQRGASGRDDSEPLPSGRWAESSDPVLRKGFPALYSNVTGLLTNYGQPTFPDHRDYWTAMWEMQGIYLSLSSVLERFGLFMFGRGAGPMKAMKELDIREAKALEHFEIPVVEVYSMKDRSNTRLSSADKPFQTWYQVRSNLIHQGKSTRDFERLFHSVNGLGQALALILAERVPGLADRWKEDLDETHPIFDVLG